MQNLIKNPSFSDLIGGIQYVTLSDEEARRRGTQKSILERKAYPAFEVIIEINSPNSWTIHENVKNSVDLFLRDNFLLTQTRDFSVTERIQIKSPNSKKFSTASMIHSNRFNQRLDNISHSWSSMNQSKLRKPLKLKSQKLIIYPYSLSNNLLKEVLLKIGVKFSLTHDIKKANLIIGLKKYLKHNLKLKALAKKKNIPIYALNQLSLYQVSKFIQFIQ